MDFIRSVGPRRWAAQRLSELFSPRRELPAATAEGPAGDQTHWAWSAVNWLTFVAAAGAVSTFWNLRFGQSAWAGLAVCVFSFFVWSTLQAMLGRLLPVIAWTAGACCFSFAQGLPWKALGVNTLRLAAFAGAMGLGMQVLAASLKSRVGALPSRGLAAVAIASLMALPMLLGLFSPFLQVSPVVILSAAVLGLGWAAVAVNVREDALEWLAKDLRPYLILAPASWSRIRQDPEFYREHFSMRYPDGLTSEQATALRDWCGKNSVERLRVQRTLSFAFWIFFGFFLCAALERDLIGWMMDSAPTAAIQKVEGIRHG